MRTTSPDQYPIAIRTALSPGDSDAIVALHDRVYAAEHGLDRRFAASVSMSIEAVVASGWPDTAGAAWLIDRGSDLGGSLALQGVTISGGRGGRGGGIRNDGGTLALDRVALRGNRAGVGGGLFNDGNAVLTDVVIAGNSARVGSASSAPAGPP